MKKNKNESNIIATNRKAYHDYFIEDTYEAGIVLVGSEVKSLRLKAVGFVDSYIQIDGYKVTLVNLNISPYEKGSVFNLPPKRPRMLLLNKKEINKLRALVERKGYTLVPTKLYFKESLVKVEVGVALGKHTYDKRKALMEKQLDLETKRYK